MDDSTLTDLVSGAPQTPEQTAAIVGELRRKRAYGELAQMSGDAALRPFGTSLLSDVQENTRQAGTQQLKNRSDDLAAQQFKNLMEHQGTQETQAQNALSETMRWHNQMDARAREINQANIDAGKYAGKSESERRLLDQEQQRMDQQTNKMSNALSTLKLPALGSAIHLLNNTMDKQTDANNLPGMGHLKNLPFAGIALSDEGKDFKSQAQAVVNDLLNVYSGQAVTEPEDLRRAQEMMTSAKFSSADFARAWPRIVQRYNEVKNGVLGGYRPEVRAQYSENNGGVNLGDITPLDPFSKAARAAARGTPGAGSGGPAGAPLAAPTGAAGPITGTIHGQAIVAQRPNKRTGKLEAKLADGSIVQLE